MEELEINVDNLGFGDKEFSGSQFKSQVSSSYSGLPIKGLQGTSATIRSVQNSIGGNLRYQKKTMSDKLSLDSFKQAEGYKTKFERIKQLNTNV